MSLDKNQEVTLLADLIFGTLFHKQTCFYNGYETSSTENHTKVKNTCLIPPTKFTQFWIRRNKDKF